MLMRMCVYRTSTLLLQSVRVVRCQEPIPPYPTTATLFLLIKHTSCIGFVILYVLSSKNTEKNTMCFVKFIKKERSPTYRLRPEKKG